MKRLAFLLISIIMILSFASCKNEKILKGPGKYIEKAQLSEEENQLALLFDSKNINNIFDFAVDDTAKSMEIKIHCYKDGKWEDFSTSRFPIDEEKGRIGIFYNKLYDVHKISFQTSKGTNAVGFSSDDKFENLEGLGFGSTILSNKKSITYEEEIPVALQIFSSKDTVGIVLNDSMEELKDYCQNTEVDHEAIFAVTVKFSQNMFR